MKLNLGCGSDLRNGYLNLDIVLVEAEVVNKARGGSSPDTGQDDSELFRVQDITNLDDVAEDDSVEEMLLFNILQAFSFKHVYALMTHWVTKLQPGGVLKIVVPDAYERALSLMSGQIDIQNYILVTYGHHANDHDYVKTGFDLDILCDLLSDKLKLNILNKHCANGQIVVEAERPSDG